MHLGISTDGRKQLPSLTGLRGIAALWVVLYHYAIQYFPAIQPGASAHIIEKGYLAVDLFFLLSGFVLTHVYVEQFVQSPSSATWPFLRARIARLYPLHILIVALLALDYILPSLKAYVISGASLHVKLFGSQSVAALFANALMLQGIKASELSWNYPSWSISIEFIGYLVFPVVVARLNRLGRTPALICLALLAGYVVFFSWLIGGDFNQWDGWPAFARCIPEFFAGILLYTCSRNLPSHSKAGALCTILILCLLLLLQMDAPDAAIVLLFACTIPLVVFGSSAVSIVLNSRAIVLVGELSYALYLIHGLLQTVVSQLLTNLSIFDDELSRAESFGLLLALVTFSLLCAYWMHKAIELPARRYLRSALQKQPKLFWSADNSAFKAVDYEEPDEQRGALWHTSTNRI
jgi:peptidoglycan/LPS O-acetylase OafA/YrhL